MNLTSAHLAALANTEIQSYLDKAYLQLTSYTQVK